MYMGGFYDGFTRRLLITKVSYAGNFHLNHFVAQLVEMKIIEDTVPFTMRLPSESRHKNLLFYIGHIWST